MKKRTDDLLYTTCSLLIFSLILSGQADAYLNPGTGSIAFQLIAAFLFGGLFTVRLYWKKIKDKLRIILKKGRHKIEEP